MKIVTDGIELNNFLLTFSRFTNLRGSVKTIYSDKGSTFCAAAATLPKLLGSNDFTNSLRKKGTNRIRILAYAPSQDGSRKIMVKLFRTALCQVVGHARRFPKLINQQMFASDAVRDCK